MSLDPKQPRDDIPSDLQDGVRVGLLSVCATNSKNGTMNRWSHIDTQAFFTNFTGIRFPCDPESTSASAEDALLSGCKNQNDKERAVGAHPVPEASDATYQSQNHRCSKRQLRKW